MALEVQNKVTADSKNLAEKLLKDYGPYDFKDSYPNQLSGGMRQRVALIRTLAMDPASVPTIVSALKINVGLSWVGVIVGEFLVSKAGLGYLIVYGGQVFRLDLVMTSVIILSVAAALMYQGVVLLEKILVKWY